MMLGGEREKGWRVYKVAYINDVNDKNMMQGGGMSKRMGGKGQIGKQVEYVKDTCNKVVGKGY